MEGIAVFFKYIYTSLIHIVSAWITVILFFQLNCNAFVVFDFFDYGIFGRFSFQILLILFIIFFRFKFNCLLQAGFQNSLHFLSPMYKFYHVFLVICKRKNPFKTNFGYCHYYIQNCYCAIFHITI